MKIVLAIIATLFVLSMFVRVQFIGRFVGYGKRIEIISHGLLGIFCYLTFTKDIIGLFLIFVLIELIQWKFCKRGFGYNDIVYSMYGVSIIYFIDKYFLT